MGFVAVGVLLLVLVVIVVAGNKVFVVLLLPLSLFSILPLGVSRDNILQFSGHVCLRVLVLKMLLVGLGIGHLGFADGAGDGQRSLSRLLLVLGTVALLLLSGRRLLLSLLLGLQFLVSTSHVLCLRAPASDEGNWFYFLFSH